MGSVAHVLDNSDKYGSWSGCLMGLWFALDASKWSLMCNHILESSWGLVATPLTFSTVVLQAYISGLNWGNFECVNERRNSEGRLVTYSSCNSARRSWVRLFPSLGPTLTIPPWKIQRTRKFNDRWAKRPTYNCGPRIVSYSKIYQTCKTDPE